ncbi:MAG: sigma-70 family RNA polymerase sigma factor [Verrucomicrobia bacterium]|jgi:RNA polymerase sigma-70 factor, ECF subfamily|nr:sigma-70 family RNA polymerase sigma factor [Verrucomicrobiota bacterium]
MQGPDPLEQTYDKHAQSIYAFLLRFLGDEADVRDVMQDLFCRIARNPDLIREARDERALLIRMAHRQAIDAIRRRDARSRAHIAMGEHQSDWQKQSTESDEQTIQLRLEDAVKTLPKDQSIVIHLRLKEEMSFEQVAQTLDISPNTAASRYRYGIEKLRNLLKSLYEEIK